MVLIANHGSNMLTAVFLLQGYNSGGLGCVRTKKSERKITKSARMTADADMYGLYRPESGAFSAPEVPFGTTIVVVAPGCDDIGRPPIP